MKIFNLFRQTVQRSSLTLDKYLPYYGDNDDFPLKWHDIIANSPTATACVGTISDFMEGYGFSDPELEKLPVDSQGCSFFEIHQKTCESFAEYEGFYWLLRFDGTGKRVTEWRVLPFENCRLGKPDDKGYISKILVNPFYGTMDYNAGRSHRDTKVYDVFNPTAVASQMADQKKKYKGQIFFYGTTNAESRFYPKPKAHSAAKWMGTEKGVADYHEENINNAFLQPFMLAMIGNPNEPVEAATTDNPTPQTRGAQIDEIISRNFMGAKRIGNFWLEWFTNKEEVPVPIAFPSNNKDDLFITIDSQAQKKITTAFKVPPILANIESGATLGGDGNMLRVAVKFMQQRVVKPQRILTDSYEKVLKLMGYVNTIKISPYNPFPELEVLDDKIWAALTTEEQRKWIEENTEIELIVVPTSLPRQQPQLPAAPVQNPTKTLPKPAQNTFNNSLPTSFPDRAMSNVKKALKYMDDIGLKCGGKSGREVSDSIVTNSNMGHKQLKRIHSFLKKNSQYENALLSDGCDAILYNAWGGKEMHDFLEVELERIDTWLNKIN